MATAPAAVTPLTVRYAEPEYWNSRYEREPGHFDWFFGPTALRRVIRTTLQRKKPVLQVGCGTSTLQHGMAEAGYTVVNVRIEQPSHAQRHHCMVLAAAERCSCQEELILLLTVAAVPPPS
jgi:hypothetical protein